ncbi:MAG: SDR family oxidoreductase [Chryseolinea sp.]
MRILITGSNGLLGQKLVALLSGMDSLELFATAKDVPPSRLTKGEFHILDISDKQQVEQVVNAIRPDVIINAAAMTQVDPCELEQEACRRVNVDGVKHLMDSAKISKAHLIHISTDFIFDGTQEMVDESAVPNPVNYYGASKLDGEEVLLKSDISWCIIRTVLVYGVTAGMSRSNIVLWVKKSLEDGKEIKVVSDQWRTPTLAEDLAVACYAAAVKRATGIFHVSGKDYLSVYQIALRVADFFHLDKTLITPIDSASFVQPGRRPLKTGFKIDKARKELGFEPHALDQGLEVVKQQIEKVKRGQ